MLKKVLFVAISLLIGMLVLSQAMYSNFYKVFQKQTSEAVKKGEYLNAERYFSFVISEENKVSFQVPESDVVIEVYASMSQNIRQYEVKNEKDKDKEPVYSQYTTLESGLQISIFNLPKDFALEDTPADKDKGIEGYKGGVTLNFSDGVKQKYDFNNTKTRMNYYAYADFYSFMPMTVYYDDYKNNVNKTTGDLVSITITDGAGDTSYEVPVTTGLDFDNILLKTFEEKINAYNKIQSVVVDNKKPDEKELNKVFKEINDMVNAKDSQFIAQHPVSVIQHSGAFIWRMVVAAGFFLLVDGLLGFLLFHKRKPKTVQLNRNIRPANKPVSNGPNNANASNNKKAKPQPQLSNPEQLNRQELFGGNDKKEVLERLKAENSEETIIDAEIVEPEKKAEDKTENK